MTVTARKYNPGFLSDDELVASFCVRWDEFESMVETLRECTGSANTHQIVIGPRGSGKTSLLLRVAAEIRRDERLSQCFFPIVFAEESYEVSTAGEFWLECVSRLAEQAPRGEAGPDLRLTYNELRQVRDDRTLGERCLGVVQDFADREDKRPILIVENLNMLLRDIGDEDTGWQLRHILQTESRILLLASATSRFDEIDNADKAFYDLFMVHTLRPLDKDDCATLWEAVSGQNRAPETIQALRILTGGSPRLLTVVARFGAKLSFRELMADLLNLVDDHTEYFKSHLDGLPAQERKVYLALAQLWRPVTAREIADRARLDTNRCSAHLKRLSERGVVEVAGGTERRKLYYVAERLYNIYYLMRRARGRASLIEALIRFMEAQYSPSELKDFVIRTVGEAISLDDEAKWMHGIAFDRLLESSSLSVYREELSVLTSWVHPFAADDEGASKVLLSRALEVATGGNESDAIAFWDEAVRRLESSDAAEDLETVAAALNNKGTALYFLNRTDEAFKVWDEVVRRFGLSQVPEHIGATATALTKKAFGLSEQGRQKEALGVCEEVLHRLEQDSVPQLPLEMAEALHSIGLVLRDLDRPEEALRVWGEFVQRIGDSDDPAMRERICVALQSRGALLARMDRLEEALATWDEIVERFGASSSSEVFPAVVAALVNKGGALVRPDSLEEALEVLEDLIERFGDNNSPKIIPLVGKALVGKATVLVSLNRPDNALEVWDEALRRSVNSDDPAVNQQVGIALANKSILLEGMGRKEEGLDFLDQTVENLSKSERPELVLAAVEALERMGAWLAEQNRLEEALSICDKILRRFGSTNVPMICDAMADILAKKGVTLAQMNRPDEALAVWEDVVRRFGSSDSRTAQITVAMSLVRRGSMLADLNRPQDAVDVMDDVVRRFASTSMEASLRPLITTALLGKARALTSLNRLQEAVAVYDEVLDRHSSGTTLESVRPVASALVAKGAVLARLNRPMAALTTLDDAVRRCGTKDDPMLQHGAKYAQLKIAELHLAMGRGDASVAAAGRLFEPEYPKSPEIGCQGHLTRARAHLLQGDKAACMLDIDTALTILSELDSLPREVLDGLSWLAVELGPAQLRELILESPTSKLLIPLTTALERELGLETRVAKEVEEVAEDLQRDLEERRKGRYHGGV